MKSLRLLIVEARFYEALNDALVAGAKAALDKAGVLYDHEVIPGALELPAAIAFAEVSGRYDGYVALGIVIRGETYHFDIVANESARGLNDLAFGRGLAIGNGVLTVETEDQAWVRVRENEKDKGGEAARAALRMIDLKQKFGQAI